MTAPLISDLAASFRRHLRAAHKAERTQVLYGQSIRFFCDWLAEQQRPLTLDQLTRHAISAWLAELSERVDVETVRTRLRGMRRFCRWLVAEGELDKPPTEGVEMPAPSEKVVRVFTDDEIRRMLKACAVPRGRTSGFDRRIFDGRRDELVLRMLLDCGLRVSELVGVELEHLELDQEVVYVIGKGSRPGLCRTGRGPRRPWTATCASAVHTPGPGPARTCCWESGGRCRPTGCAGGWSSSPRSPGCLTCTRTRSATPSRTAGCPPVARNGT